MPLSNKSSSHKPKRKTPIYNSNSNNNSNSNPNPKKKSKKQRRPSSNRTQPVQRTQRNTTGTKGTMRKKLELMKKMRELREQSNPSAAAAARPSAAAARPSAAAAAAKPSAAAENNNSDNMSNNGSAAENNVDCIDADLDEIINYKRDHIDTIELVDNDNKIFDALKEAKLYNSLDAKDGSNNLFDIVTFLEKYVTSGESDNKKYFFTSMDIKKWLRIAYEPLFYNKEDLFIDQIKRAIYIMNKINYGCRDITAIMENFNITDDYVNNRIKELTIYDDTYMPGIGHLGELDQTFLYLDGPGRFTYCCILVLYYKYMRLVNGDDAEARANLLVKYTLTFYFKLFNDNIDIINFTKYFFPRKICNYQGKRKNKTSSLVHSKNEDILTHCYGLRKLRSNYHFYFNFMGVSYESVFVTNLKSLFRDNPIKPKTLIFNIIKKLPLSFITFSNRNNATDGRAEALLTKIMDTPQLHVHTISERGLMISLCCTKI